MKWKFWEKPKSPKSHPGVAGRKKGVPSRKSLELREEEAYLKQLRHTNPDAYNEMIEERIRKRLGIAPTKHASPVENFKSQFTEVMEMAKWIGAAKNPPAQRDGALALAEILAQNPDALKVVLDTAVKVAGNGAPAMLSRLTGGQNNPAPPTQQVTIEPPRPPTPPVQIEQPAQPPPSNVTQFPAPPAIEYGDKARELIAFLQDKPPTVAAQWLAEQMKQSNDARMLGAMMMNGPDHELSNRLLRLDGLGPIAGLGTWFLDRFDWSRETITELRRLTSGQSAAS